jgi:hypothetical protein
VILADRDRQLGAEVASDERSDGSRRLGASHPSDVDAGDPDTRQDPIRMTGLVPVRCVCNPAEHERCDTSHRNDDGDVRAEPALAAVSSSGHGDYRNLWIRR